MGSKPKFGLIIYLFVCLFCHYRTNIVQYIHQWRLLLDVKKVQIAVCTCIKQHRK